ncbi:hypothetical protein PsorP6_014546 [Peronosclerospora sorghi]|uniref:Uncharacterized protein n=1 Tax=Peronosclerospora sorghi TaxID=230839 RepID=A0ACC0VTQ4_9STRA|nr:hypothetical protein PsorP6_014546 [Peronosclerospora sorghi]
MCVCGEEARPNLVWSTLAILSEKNTNKWMHTRCTFIQNNSSDTFQQQSDDNVDDQTQSATRTLISSVSRRRQALSKTKHLNHSVKPRFHVRTRLVVRRIVHDATHGMIRRSFR